MSDLPDPCRIERVGVMSGLSGPKTNCAGQTLGGTLVQPPGCLSAGGR